MAKLLLLVLTATLYFGCSDASTVSHNISKASDYFEIQRRVVFFNGITDKYLLSIEGRCSIDDTGRKLEVTCKEGPQSFKKHYLGLSDNVSYFVEQMDAVYAGDYHYRVVFKPATIIPKVEVK